MKWRQCTRSLHCLHWTSYISSHYLWSEGSELDHCIDFTGRVISRAITYEVKAVHSITAFSSLDMNCRQAFEITNMFVKDKISTINSLLQVLIGLLTSLDWSVKKSWLICQQVLIDLSTSLDWSVNKSWLICQQVLIDMLTSIDWSVNKYWLIC